MQIRTGVRIGRLALAAMLALAPMPALFPVPALAQNQPLLPPALPSTLPGGVALPNLAGGSQAEILQRILDAAGGRPATPSPAPPSPQPFPAPAAFGNPYLAAPPAGANPSLARAEPTEPLSNTEAFFAARLPEQQPPLRQFGYDTF